MTGYEAVQAFAAQLRSRTDLKVIVAPSPIKEPGPHVKIAVRKIVTLKTPKAAVGEKELRLFVSVDGSVESDTGLRLALETCEALTAYLATCSRLESELAEPIAGTRIVTTMNDDDGILQDPDNGNLAWLDDLHFVSVWIPA